MSLQFQKTATSTSIEINLEKASAWKGWANASFSILIMLVMLAASIFIILYGFTPIFLLFTFFFLITLGLVVFKELWAFEGNELIELTPHHLIYTRKWKGISRKRKFKWEKLKRLQTGGHYHIENGLSNHWHNNLLFGYGLRTVVIGKQMTKEEANSILELMCSYKPELKDVLVKKDE